MRGTRPWTYGRHGTTTTTTRAAVIALIFAALKAADRSPAWLIRKSGLNASTVRRKLKGDGDFSVGDLGTFARVLGIRLTALIPDDAVEVEGAKPLAA